MHDNPSRRAVLKSAMVGVPIIFAGCSSNSSEPTEGPDQNKFLVIESGTVYTIISGGSESYDGVEIEPSGTLITEHSAELQLRS